MSNIATDNNNINQTTVVRWTPPWGSALPPPIKCKKKIPQESLCPICMEAEAMLVLDSCKQRICQACLATWFVRHSRKPACPFCRAAIPRATLVNMLGMDPPIQAKDDELDGSALDELLEFWLQAEQAKPCPACGMYITKDGGCNHMTCVCGYNFCWFCQSEDYDECGCDESDSSDESDDSDEEEEVLPVRDPPIQQNEEIQVLESGAEAHRHVRRLIEQWEGRSAQHDAG